MAEIQARLEKRYFDQWRSMVRVGHTEQLASKLKVIDDVISEIENEALNG